MNGNSAVYAAIVGLLKFWPVFLASYVFFGWSMSRMAQRRGIAGWILGWFPMMNLWIMGSLCDQYRYVVFGKKSRSRFWLPILAVVLEVLVVFGALGLQGQAGFLPALWATALDVTMAVFLVRIYLSLYRLYVSCEPRHAVSWLVLSVVLPFLPVVFLLAGKEKEQGMPVRRVMFLDELKRASAGEADKKAAEVQGVSTELQSEEGLTENPGDGVPEITAVASPETVPAIEETHGADSVSFPVEVPAWEETPMTPEDSSPDNVAKGGTKDG